jgi:hypothetical protein
MPDDDAELVALIDNELDEGRRTSVVGIVEPSVRRSEVERSRRKRPESLDAYDLYLRALTLMATISVADAPAAAPLLRDALKLDPNLAVAHAYLSWCHQILFTHGGFGEARSLGSGTRAQRLRTRWTTRRRSPSGRW